MSQGGYQDKLCCDFSVFSRKFGKIRIIPTDLRHIEENIPRIYYPLCPNSTKFTETIYKNDFLMYNNLVSINLQKLQICNFRTIARIGLT